MSGGVERTGYEPEQVSSGIRAIHDIPLRALQPDGESNLHGFSRVSLYQYQGEEGLEHVVVGPTLSGYEWYNNFRAIAPDDPGFYDVIADTRIMLQIASNEHLSRVHQKAGKVWNIALASLPVKLRAMEDDYKYGDLRDDMPRLEQVFKDKLRHIVSDSFAIPRDEIGKQQVREWRQILNGKTKMDPRQIMNLCGLDKPEVGRAISNMIPRYGFRDEYVFNSEFSRLSTGHAVQAIRGAIRIKHQRDNKYKHLTQFSIPQRYVMAEAADVLSRFKAGDREYGIPTGDMKLAPVSEKDGSFRIQLNSQSYRTNPSVVIYTWIQPTADGFTIAKETFRDQLQEGVEQRRLNRNKIIPVVRVGSEPDKPFFIHEVDPLPADVIDRIVADKKVKEPHANSSWVSGVAGVEMMALAHRTLREMGDNWSKSMWHDEKVTISGLRGEPRKTFHLPDGSTKLEKEQFNGPVQLSVTALEAARWYPGVFRPFNANVRAQFNGKR